MSETLNRRMSQRESRRVNIAKPFQVDEAATVSKFDSLKLKSALAIASGDVGLLKSCLAELHTMGMA